MARPAGTILVAYVEPNLLFLLSHGKILECSPYRWQSTTQTATQQSTNEGISKVGRGGGDDSDSSGSGDNGDVTTRRQRNDATTNQRRDQKKWAVVAAAIATAMAAARMAAMAMRWRGGDATETVMDGDGR